MQQQQTAFENIVGKAEIAHNEQFLLFPQCFQLNQIMVYPFVRIFDILSFFAAEFEDPKIEISGKGLKKILTEKGENVALNSIFSITHNVFKQLLSRGSLKILVYVV